LRDCDQFSLSHDFSLEFAVQLQGAWNVLIQSP
jgi:hypothetical protein